MKNIRYLALILAIANADLLWLLLILAENDVWPLAIGIRNLSEDDYIGEVPSVLTVSRLSQSLAMHLLR